VSRFLTLTPGERLVVLAAAAGLAAAPILLRSAGLTWVMRHLTRRPCTRGTPPTMEQLSSRRIVGLVERTAAALPWTITCLHRSLIAAWLVRRAGRPCKLVLGVAASAGDFAAHAWVALADEPLGEPMTLPYTPICEWAIAFPTRSL
jgi:hypothetical protein